MAVFSGWFFMLLEAHSRLLVEGEAEYEQSDFKLSTQQPPALTYTVGRKCLPQNPPHKGAYFCKNLRPEL
jgi:hypothetical protein